MGAHWQHTHEAMLSPNVTNAVTRLSSGCLFKSQHQTHSFLVFISTHHRSFCQGERPLLICSAAGVVVKHDPDFQRESLALFHHLQRERAVPVPPFTGTTQLTVRRTMDSRAGGGSGLIEKGDVTDISPWHCQAPALTELEGERVKSEGGRQNGNRAVGSRGPGAWMQTVFMEEQKETHSPS